MRRLGPLALLAACAVIGAGCGEQAEGPATSVVVTRDFGAEVVAAHEQVPFGAGLTVMRQLQRAHNVTTSYGGRYVDSINSLKEDADSSWLVYVDGVESPRGAAATRMRAGQLVQWDFHPWQLVRTGGAIVGAYPQPMKSRGARVICAAKQSATCSDVETDLKAAGVELSGSDPVSVVVGPWPTVGKLKSVPDLTESGESNGAFAQFSADGKTLTPFAADGQPQRKFSGDAGLLAAFAQGTDMTFLVTGTSEQGVAGAVDLLDSPAQLENRFALMTSGGKASALPWSAER